MPKLVKDPIVFQPRSVHASLKLPIATRLLHAIQLSTDDSALPSSYEAKRVGIKLSVAGRWPLPVPVAARLLQSEFDVMVHGSGCVSIPRPRTETPRSRKERRAGLVRRAGAGA